jgi:hypothetical protein
MLLVCTQVPSSFTDSNTNFVTDAAATTTTTATTTTDAADAAYAEKEKDAEKRALGYLGAILGGIVVLMAIRYGWSESDHRDVELYMIVGGGLLDAASDALYLAFETFDPEQPGLEEAAVAIMALPVALVSLCFWAIITINYKHQKWRVMLLPIEAPLILLTVIVSVAVNWTISSGTLMFGFTLGFSSDVKDPLFNKLNSLFRYTYINETPKTTFERKDDGGREKEEIIRDIKFYHEDLPHLIVAITLVPVVLLVSGLVGFVTVTIIWILGFWFTLVGATLSMVAAVLLALILPVIFSVMAFLRLFVLAPSAWEAIAKTSIWFADFANEYVSIFYRMNMKGYNYKFEFFSDQRAKKVEQQIFNIFDDGAQDVDDLKLSAVKYLTVEFLLESFPQIIIQVLNNNSKAKWSAIAIASMAFSSFAIANTLYKYGYFYLCARKRRANDNDRESSTDGAYKELVEGKPPKHSRNVMPILTCMCTCTGYTGWARQCLCSICGADAECDDCGRCHNGSVEYVHDPGQPMLRAECWACPSNKAKKVECICGYNWSVVSPLSRTASIEWYKKVEESKGSGKTDDGGFADWFHGIISRADAEVLLQGSRDGTFLIRVAESRFGYSLSMWWKGAPKHFMIDQNEQERYIVVGNDRTYPSLNEVVAFHTKHAVTDDGDVLTGAVHVDGPRNDLAELKG